MPTAPIFADFRIGTARTAGTGPGLPTGAGASRLVGTENPTADICRPPGSGLP